MLDFSLQHPQIQKESQYIKYLCCDDAWTMNLWVTGIRIAKVNSVLHPVTGNDLQWTRTHVILCGCVSCTHSTVCRCMKTIKQPRRRLLSARRGRTAALHQAPIHQRPRPPSKVARHTRAAFTECFIDVKQPRCGDFFLRVQCVHSVCFSFSAS